MQADITYTNYFDTRIYADAVPSTSSGQAPSTAEGTDDRRQNRETRESGYMGRKTDDGGLSRA